MSSATDTELETFSIAASAVVGSSMDRFPPLIVFRCLSSAAKELAQNAKAMRDAGASAVTEVISRPARSVWFQAGRDHVASIEDAIHGPR